MKSERAPQPGSGQPGGGQPGSGQPGGGQPGDGQPGSGQPGGGSQAGSSPVSGVIIDGIEVGADLLSRRIAPCSIGACGGQCCRFGAMVEPPEIAQIDALLPRLLPRLRPAARQVIRRHGWAFRQSIHERYADPDKRYQASRVAGGLCVFVLDSQKGGCALHQAALEDGVPVEQYKPRECVLFPLGDVVRGTLHLHTWPGYPCTADSPCEQPAWQTLEHELQLVLGLEGYETLSQVAAGLEQEGVLIEPAPYADPPPVARGRRPARQE